MSGKTVPKTYVSCGRQCACPKALDPLDRYPITRVRCPDTCTSNPLTPPPPSAPRHCAGIGWRPKSRFPSQAPEWQARPSISTGHSSPTWQHLHSSHDSPQLASFPSHLPLPPAKRTRARSASSPPPFFPECLFKIPIFSSCLSVPYVWRLQPPEPPARIPHPRPRLRLRLRQSLPSGNLEEHSLDCPPPSSAPPSLAPSLYHHE